MSLYLQSPVVKIIALGCVFRSFNLFAQTRFECELHSISKQHISASKAQIVNCSFYSTSVLTKWRVMLLSDGALVSPMAVKLLK